MVNPITFYSQSANDKNLSQECIPEPLLVKVHKPVVIFLGNIESEFIEYGEKLGFQCVIYDKTSDPSYIVQSKIVVAQNMQYHFKQYVELIDLAVNYGITTIWLHSLMPPSRWMWSFNYCLVDVNLQSIDLWRMICQKVM